MPAAPPHAVGSMHAVNADGLTKPPPANFLDVRSKILLSSSSFVLACVWQSPFPRTAFVALSAALSPASFLLAVSSPGGQF